MSGTKTSTSILFHSSLPRWESCLQCPNRVPVNVYLSEVLQSRGQCLRVHPYILGDRDTVVTSEVKAWASSHGVSTLPSVVTVNTILFSALIHWLAVINTHLEYGKHLQVLVCCSRHTAWSRQFESSVSCLSVVQVLKTWSLTQFN